MSQQTAVEWMAQELQGQYGKDYFFNIVAKAKEMERQALSDMYEKGRNDERELGAKLLGEVLKNK